MLPTGHNHVSTMSVKAKIINCQAHSIHVFQIVDSNPFHKTKKGTIIDGTI